ncbi:MULTISPECIES: hypothetical protein [Acinetobacter]|uniref:Uncharacterized protein n=1 Tax=Acinetobacter indicus TaxID=756892 RepID=A0A6C0Y731_9GAMM|nr:MULTISPECIES: hypothetical protein [Acinetobacter]QIC72067.1 hypothetical protein FSC09_17060 [Acinetobacter indicus]QKQ71532.1 hypothetical protein E5Y90_14970 [Acinetobacter sp. 10FS3-1]
MKKLFTVLNGQTVRLVVETDNLRNGTETFGCFEGYPYKAGSKLHNVQFVDQFGNNMGRDGILEMVKEIQIINNHDGSFKSVLKIIDVDYVEEVMTFVVTLENNRTVQVQFKRETNRLHADYNTHLAHIDRCNVYGYDLSKVEEELFNDWISTCKAIQDVVKELDSQYE